MTANARRPLVVTPRQMATIMWLNACDVAYRFTFHALRVVSGVYVLRALLTFPQGLWRVSVVLVRWVADVDGKHHAATINKSVGASNTGSSSLTNADKRHDERVWTRLAGSIAAAAVLVFVARYVADEYGTPALAGAGLAVATLIGFIGRDTERPFLDDANEKRKTPTITAELLAETFSAIGVADLAKALWDKNEKRIDSSRLRLRSGRTPSNNGQIIEVELPTGITAEMVMVKADRVAGGLRRPDDQLYLERAPGGHPGVLSITVLDRPTSAEPPKQFAVPDSVNIFEPIPVGYRPGGEPVMLTLAFQSLLIGGAPDAGKTAALRTIATVAGVDPAVQLIVSEMKGTGDLAALRPRCMFYRSGNDDDDLRATATMLRWLVDEMRRRQRIIGELAETDLRRVPENKITRELALDPELRMPVLLVILDEFTELSESTEFGSAFNGMLDLVRQARAVGIITVLGTQRPDSGAITPRMRDLLTLRSALRCLSSDAANMILGNGSTTAGFDPTMFSPGEQGMCWLRGDSGEPELMRWGWLPPVSVIEIIEQQSTTVVPIGHAAGEPSAGGAPVDDDDRRVIDHILEVWPHMTDVMPTSVIADRLIDEYGAKYDGWTGATVTRSLRTSHGLTSTDRRVDGRLLKTFARDELVAAAQAERVMS